MANAKSPTFYETVQLLYDYPLPQVNTSKPATMMELLRLPVVCLATANFDMTISDVLQGKVTVIGA